MTSYRLSGARIVDQYGERAGDVTIADGVIVESAADATVLDCTGLVVSPGFVDLHTHLREPGQEEAETIETGSRAAALGGFTAVVAMPNTDPTQDSVSVVDFVRAQGRAAGLCDVHPAGSITVGRAGGQLTPFGELAGAGVQDPLLMRRALEYAGDLGITLAQHCEVARLTEGAVMHEGECCSHLGLPGWPALAEELMVHRDIELVRLTGVPMHFLHLSTARSVELVRAAKADGLAVTAEATPHHISLTDELLRGYSALYKVNPPLRTMDDVLAVRAGLADGTIDVIATDHAPHPTEAKERPFEEAPSGMLGLETALALVWEELVRPGVLTPAQALAAASWKGAAIAGLAHQGQPVAVDAVANLCVFDPEHRWEVDADRLASKARNTPYAGRTLTGKVRHTILRGEVVVRDGEAQR